MGSAMCWGPTYANFLKKRNSKTVFVTLNIHHASCTNTERNSLGLICTRTISSYQQLPCCVLPANLITLHLRVYLSVSEFKMARKLNIFTTYWIHSRKKYMYTVSWYIYTKIKYKKITKLWYKQMVQIMLAAMSDPVKRS